jgi:hypothetical protein
MLLTEGAFRLAERRLQDLPDRADARLTIRPEADGFVTVRAALVERSGLPQGAFGWTAAALQAGLDRETRLAIPGSTGQGELWSMSWRWWSGRPRVAIGFSAPHIGWLPGVWRVDASWESQRYQTEGDETSADRDESRSFGSLTLSDWSSPNVRYSATAGVETWNTGTGARRTIVAGGTIERRWLDDRWTVWGRATTWTPFGAPRYSRGFHTGSVGAAFISSRSPERWVHQIRAGVERASDNSPLGVWPGAGEGRVREPLLRAHPLLTAGVIELTNRSVFGKTVVDSHVETERWITSAFPIRAGLAGFVDAAHASRRYATGALTQIDMGGGLRVRMPGAAGTLRVDIAHGVLDGADALTMGWQY